MYSATNLATNAKYPKPKKNIKTNADAICLRDVHKIHSSNNVKTQLNKNVLSKSATHSLKFPCKPNDAVEQLKNGFQNLTPKETPLKDENQREKILINLTQRDKMSKGITLNLNVNKKFTRTSSENQLLSGETCKEFKNNTFVRSKSFYLVKQPAETISKAPKEAWLLENVENEDYTNQGTSGIVTRSDRNTVRISRNKEHSSNHDTLRIDVRKYRNIVQNSDSIDTRVDTVRSDTHKDRDSVRISSNLNQDFDSGSARNHESFRTDTIKCENTVDNRPRKDLNTVRSGILKEVDSVRCDLLSEKNSGDAGARFRHNKDYTSTFLDQNTVLKDTPSNGNTVLVDIHKNQKGKSTHLDQYSCHNILKDHETEQVSLCIDKDYDQNINQQIILQRKNFTSPVNDTRISNDLINNKTTKYIIDKSVGKNDDQLKNQKAQNIKINSELHNKQEDKCNEEKVPKPIIFLKEHNDSKIINTTTSSKQSIYNASKIKNELTDIKNINKEFISKKPENDTSIPNKNDFNSSVQIYTFNKDPKSSSVAYDDYNEQSQKSPVCSNIPKIIQENLNDCLEPRYSGYKPKNGICFVSFKSMFSKPLTMTCEDNPTDFNELDIIDANFDNPQTALSKESTQNSQKNQFLARHSTEEVSLNLSNSLPYLSKKDKEYINKTREELRESIVLAEKSKMRENTGKKIHLNIFLKDRIDKYKSSPHTSTEDEEVNEEDSIDTNENIKKENFKNNSFHPQNSLHKNNAKQRESSYVSNAKMTTTIDHIKSNHFKSDPQNQMEKEVKKQNSSRLSVDDTKTTTNQLSLLKTTQNTNRLTVDEQKSTTNQPSLLKTVQNTSRLSVGGPKTTTNQPSLLKTIIAENNKKVIRRKHRIHRNNTQITFNIETEIQLHNSDHRRSFSTGALLTTAKETSSTTNNPINEDPSNQVALIETASQPAKNTGDEALIQVSFQPNTMNHSEKVMQGFKKKLEESLELYRRLQFCGIKVAKETVVRALMSPAQIRIYEQLHNCSTI